MTINNIAQRDLGRSDAYRLLAASFYEPDRNLFLEEKLISNLATALREAGSPVEKDCLAMSRELRDQNQEALLVEYSALFLGPFNAPATPYGSIYLEQARQLMGDTTMTVKRMYHEAGITQETDGPPDHIALELEFMSYLAGCSAQALAAGDDSAVAKFSDLQQRFFNTCLAQWVPPFCRAIRDNATLKFYPALACALESFILLERAILTRKTAARHAPVC